MMSAVGEPDRGAGRRCPASTPAAIPDFTITIAATQPAKRDGRADRKIEAAADDDEGHADGDHRHDRGLHQDVGEVERRQEAVGQQRRDHAQHDERDQRHLAGEVEALAPCQPPIAACSRCSSKPVGAIEARRRSVPDRSAQMLSQRRVSSARSLEIDQHAAAARGEVADQRMDLRLGGDVDALRRLVEQQHADLARQPFGQDHLLLIAAGQRARLERRPARPDVEQLHQLGDDAVAGARDRARPARDSAVEARQQDVVAHRLVHHQAEPPLARHHADAGADGVGRAP